MELRYFILRRILLLIPTLAGLLILVFALFMSLPHSLLELSLFPGIPHNAPLEEAQGAQILGLPYTLNGIYHPGLPLPLQFGKYVVRLFQGNWGYMTVPIYSGSVIGAITTFFPNTAQLVIIASILAIVISIPLGTFIGARPNTISDHVGRIFTFIGYAIPAFVLGTFLLAIFSKGGIIPIFPSANAFSASAIPNPPPSWMLTSGDLFITSPTHIVLVDSLLHGDLGLAWNTLMHTILPVLTLTYGLLAGIMRFIRAGMVDSARQEYVKTARSEGVPERIVIREHIRRNALIPTITVMGLIIASLLGGVVVVEEVFSYPGMGLLTVQAAVQTQVYGVLGTTLVFGLILVLANLIVDVIYALIDPRIRY